MRVQTTFKPMGSVAPQEVPESELWLDVGGRAAIGVMDHHGGDTDAWSAAQLVLDRHDDLLPRGTMEADEVSLVLHERPDLDAICAAWLARKILEEGTLEVTRHLERIVEAVSENDQGLVRTGDPLSCWQVVMRTALQHVVPAEDEARVVEGSRLLDKTLSILSDGGSLEDAAQRLVSSSVRIELAHAVRDYREDLRSSIRFQVRLPKGRVLDRSEKVPRGPIPTPSREGRVLVDGLLLDNPTSTLFKELARGDVEQSPAGHGFGILVVVRDSEATRKNGLRKYVISTDPLAGVNLRGLGSRLEERERAHDATRDVPLPGREEVGGKKGRHGYSVPQPWYDGRGHGFTIIDSPNIGPENERVVGSQLSLQEVLAELWEYGDPAGSVTVQELTATVIWPLPDSAEGWSGSDVTEEGLEQLCPELSEEVLSSLTGVTVRRRAGGWLSKANLKDAADEIELVDDCVLGFPGGAWLWLGRFAGQAPGASLRDIARKIERLRSGLRAGRDEVLAAPMSAAEPYLLTHLRVAPKGVSLGEEVGPTSRAMYQLAWGGEMGFGHRPTEEELRQAVRVMSRDQRTLALLTERGLVVTSTHDDELASHERFYRPDHMAVLVALVLGQKTALRDVLNEFAQHISEESERGGLLEEFTGGHVRRKNSQILADRQRLMELEQHLLFRRVTDSRFGEHTYDALSLQMGVGELLDEAKAKVEVMAQHVRDRRADFYQSLSFWVTFLFFPLVLTAGLFSGIQQSRTFIEQYVGFFPWSHPLAGWLHFLCVFALTVLVTGSIWWYANKLRGSKSVTRD